MIQYFPTGIFILFTFYREFYMIRPSLLVFLPGRHYFYTNGIVNDVMLPTQYIPRWNIWIFTNIVFILPLCILLSHLLKHILIRSQPKSIPSQLYCGLSYIFIGDLLIDIVWMSSISASSTYSTRDRIIVVMIRFFFVWLGTYIGQSLVCVAITGSIATGKSTVCNMFLNNKTDNGKVRKFGSVRIIDSDRIGHEILLPKSILSSSKTENTTTLCQQQPHKPIGAATTNNTESKTLSENDNSLVAATAAAVRGSLSQVTNYSISPNDSVYNQIIETFGDASMNDTNILVDADSINKTDATSSATSSNNSNSIRLIDRTKLGSIVFNDPIARKKLNQITHPKIIYVLLKQMIYGSLMAPEQIILVDVPLLYENKIMKLFFGLTIVVGYDDTNDTSTRVQFNRLRARNPELSEKECQERIQSQIPVREKMKLADIVILNNATTTLPELQDQVEAVRKDLMGRLRDIVKMPSYIASVGMISLLSFYWRSSE